MLPHHLDVDVRQQVVAAVAATGANNGMNVVAHEHGLQFTRASLDRAGEVELAVEDRLVVNGIVAEMPQTIAAALEKFALDGAGGRDDAHAIPGTKSRR